MFFTPRKTNCKLQTANFLGCFTCCKHGGDAYGKQGYFIQFVRNNFQFSLHFLAEKFCSMKSFPYLCSVKRMKMVISSVGMLMLNAQFAASVISRQLSVALSL